MKLEDVIAPDAVVVGLRAGDKLPLLGELARRAVALLAADGRQTAPPSDSVLAALTARERLGSTGLGRGFALPHARVDGIERLFGLFVRLARPIDFEAIDGARVDLLCVLLIPASAQSEHVAALAAVARVMRQDAVLARIRRAKDAAAIYEQLISAPV